MIRCGHERSELVGLLHGELPEEDREALARRVETCAACAEELEWLTESWSALPDFATVSVVVPEGLRRAVTARARAAVAGADAARADVAEPDRAVVRGGASRPARRVVLLGAVGALAGYLLLSLLHPIPSTVEFCRVSLFGAPELALGQLCLVYLAVAALYAGVPVAVAAWLAAPGAREAEPSGVEGGTGRVGQAGQAGPIGRAGPIGWTGAAGSGLFLLLTLPVLAWQFGLEEPVITLTVFAGVAVGALVGAWTGRRIRLRMGAAR